MNRIRRDRRSFDFVLLGLVIALAAFGLLMVGSVTGLGDGHVSALFLNQLVFIVTGIGILLIVAFVNYELICKFFIPIYFVNIALLIAAELMPDHRGVGRWIGIEIGGTAYAPGFELGIQPSEFAKIFMIIVLAKIIDKYRHRINNVLVVGLVLAAAALPTVLIYLQPSLSASIVIIVIAITLLYVGKIGYRYFIIAGAIVLPLVLFVFIDIHREAPFLLESGILDDFQFRRIWGFLYPETMAEINPWQNWQNEQALLALASGILTGQGLFNNQIHVPELNNDFIFSIIGAEFGFIGSVAVLLTVLLIVIRCMLIANRSEVFLGRLIAAAAAVVIAFQAFTHVAINAWLLPNTGMNFPFVSSGGSSMWVFMAMIGLVLNVGMTREYSMFDDMGG